MNYIKNWYPDLEKNGYIDLLFIKEQNTQLWEIFFKNFKKSIVFRLGSSEDENFYDLNNKIPVIYGYKTYN